MFIIYNIFIFYEVYTKIRSSESNSSVRSNIKKNIIPYIILPSNTNKFSYSKVNFISRSLIYAENFQPITTHNFRKTNCL